MFFSLNNFLSCILEKVEALILNINWVICINMTSIYYFVP